MSMKAARRWIAVGIVVVLFGLLFWWAWASSRPATEDDSATTSQVDEQDLPVIAVSIPPVASLVEQLVGGDAEVITLLPAGTSPHTFDPRPQDVLDAKRADVLVSVGEGFDEWSETLVDERVPSIAVLDSDGLERVSYELDHEHTHEHTEEEHEHTGEDPHVWLSAENAAVFVEVLAGSLPEVESRLSASALSSRADRLAGELRTLHEELLQERASVVSGTLSVVTMHDAWRTFAEAYDVTLVGSVEETPGRIPAPEELLTLQKEAQDADVKSVFTEPQLSADVAENLACDLGVSVAVLDPLGGEGIDGRETYQELMRHNMAQLVQSVEAPASECN